MLHMYELIENNTVLITEVLGIGVNLFCYNINLFSLKAYLYHNINSISNVD